MSEPKRAIQTYKSTNAAFAAMESLRDRCNLVTPITRIDFLPMFMELSLRIVVIEPNPEMGDVYPVPGTGKLALTKVGLAKISSSADVSWAPSQRNDDGSDAFYCSYTAVGFYRSFSGEVRMIPGIAEIDLREGSAALSDIIRLAEKSGRDATAEINGARRFITRRCETSARNAALRDAFFIPSGYTHQQLVNQDGTPRAFVLPALVVTGWVPEHVPNRELLMRAFAEKQAEKALAGTAALFGGASPMVSSLGAPAVRRPPPVASVPAPTLDEEEVGGFEVPAPRTEDRQREEEEERPAPPPPRTQVPGQRAAPRAAAAAPEGEEDGEEFGLPAKRASAQRQNGLGSPGDEITVRFGSAKGKPLSQWNDREILWYADTFEADVEDPDKQRWVKENRKVLTAIRGEAARRKLTLTARQ